MRLPVSPSRNARYPFALTVVVLALAAPGCGGSLGIATGPIRSQVVDAQTGQPIAGAVVLGVWTGRETMGLPGHRPSKLVGVREVETDNKGHFTLERPREAQTGEHESVTVYKFGYVAWNNLFIFPNSVRRGDTTVPARIGLEPFPAGESHQKHLSFISGATRAAMGYGHESTPGFHSAIEAERKMP